MTHWADVTQDDANREYGHDRPPQGRTVVPDAAVEAAYAAWFAHKSLLTPGDTKVAMREALEAAAPHLESPAYRAGFLLAKDFFKEHKDKA